MKMEVLQTSVPAVNSALQRARARLAQDPPERTEVLRPEDPEQRELLEQYVRAFEAHDMVALQRVLRADARSSMPPFDWWLDGRDSILAVMAGSDACDGDRMLPVAINGSAGFGQYRLDDGVHLPFALVAIELQECRIAHVTTFLGAADRFAEFGLPSHL